MGQRLNLEIVAVNGGRGKRADVIIKTSLSCGDVVADYEEREECEGAGTRGADGAAEPVQGEDGEDAGRAGGPEREKCTHGGEGEQEE